MKQRAFGRILSVMVRDRLKRMVFRGVPLIFLMVAVLFLPDLYIGFINSDRIYKDIDALPERPVGLLLGTAKYHMGRINFFYDSRIKAAAELYESGKIKAVLVSGDNATRAYDEPNTMRRDLEALGVPGDRITLDYAGFRTLDSVIRAEKVFSQKSYTIISQEFHCRRALFISSKNHHDAVAYCAEDVRGFWGWKVRCREVLARFKAVLDIYLLDKQPKFLGPKVPVNTG